MRHCGVEVYPLERGRNARGGRAWRVRRVSGQSSQFGSSEDSSSEEEGKSCSSSSSMGSKSVARAFAGVLRDRHLSEK